MNEATPGQLARTGDARERLAERRAARKALIPLELTERRWASLSDDDIAMLRHLRQTGGGRFDVAALTAEVLGPTAPVGISVHHLVRLAAAEFVLFDQFDGIDGWHVEVTLINQETP